MFRTVIALSIAGAFAGCATTSSNDAAPAPATRTASGSAASTTPAPAPAPAPSSSLSAFRQGGGAGAKETTQRSVYYELDRAELKAEDRRVIEAHARYLREHPDAKIRIEGNADERGSSEYNLALGQRRAEGVARGLQAGGVHAERMEAVSFGKEKPRAQGHDEQSWSQNRRSDFVYR
jgi:peptidoglycan-associated lipoprotein